jgi:hypothetical protein
MLLSNADEKVNSVAVMVMVVMVVTAVAVMVMVVVLVIVMVVDMVMVVVVVITVMAVGLAADHVLVKYRRIAPYLVVLVLQIQSSDTVQCKSKVSKAIPVTGRGGP